MKKKWIIGSVIILLSISYLVYSGVRDTGMYYIKVDELLKSKNKYMGSGVRISGDIKKGSVNWDQKTLELSFVLVQDNEEIPVSYKGPLPDTFKEGRQAVVEGRLQKNNEFSADKIMAKCPSKYEIEQKAE